MSDALVAVLDGVRRVADALTEHRRAYGPDIRAIDVEGDLRRILDKWSES